MHAPRFAIYFVPPAGTEFYRFGARFLGYDCYTGTNLGHSERSGLRASEWDLLTREPRKYGFHATLKAPFRLVPPFTETDLVAELRRFAALPRAVPIIEPAVRALARFIAIVPRSAVPALDRLAANCVTTFDGFRLAATQEERNRRITPGLSARQVENVDRWGYPYVFDEFRFHLTLTGPVDAPRRGAIVTLLQALLNRVSDRSALPIAQLALVRQDDPSRPFRVVDQAELAAAY